MLDWIRGKMSQKRYDHSIGVAKTAAELAKLYGEDQERAYTAGILHDCAKEMGRQELLEKAQEYKIELDDIVKKEPYLLHAPVGAFMAREKFGIDDDVFDAIYYHSLAKEDMSKLCKILYMADYIEPGRTFDGIVEIRKLGYENLDDAMIAALDKTIRLVISNSEFLHVGTVLARNHILLNKATID